MGNRFLVAVVFSVLAASAAAQEKPPATVTPPQAPAAQSRSTRFHAEVGTFYSALSRGYSTWRGFDARVLYASRRATPFIGVSTETRKEGTQQNYGVGSYITLNDRFYSIVGVSHAPYRGAVLFPKTRIDAALFGAVRSVPGLVLFGGATKVYGDKGGGGQIFSIGSFLYHGHAIATGVVSLNRDRLSGADSHSQSLGIQYGSQGSYWIGGSISHGTEAYQVIAAAPFDARFEGAGAMLFGQKWFARNRGAVLRYEFEHKYTAYVRNAVALTYFVDF